MEDLFDSYFRVRLQEKSAKYRRVIFRTTPDVQETTNVNYKTIDPLHMPGGIHVYSGTQSRSYQLSDLKLVSRTRAEASANLQRMNLLRSWCRPRFGEKNISQSESSLKKRTERNNTTKFLQENQNEGVVNTQAQLDVLFFDDNQAYKEIIGTPPAVLLFSAYSNQKNKGNIYKIPCVITNLGITYPSDVDYIPTEEGVPFPIITTVSISLTETHSPGEYERFSLDDFRQGNLTGF